jgi:transposase
VIRLDPNGVYTAKEVAKMLRRSERTVSRAARRLGKKRGSWFSANEVRQVMGVQ